MGDDWAGYLGRFHAERPGITERVLGRAFDGGQRPYEWLAGAVGAGPVVDVGCGSAPLHGLLGEVGYRGFDVSAEELRVARGRGASVALAPAERLPVEDASVGTVVCSMTLQVVDDLPGALAEAARVLRPGGRFVAIVPAAGPLRWRDLAPVAGLLAALGERIGYPNDRAMREASALFGEAGLTLVGDERRRFVFRLGGGEDAEAFLASLYLPSVSERRLRAAGRWLRACSRLSASMPIPVRRLIATR
ncbi:class I SAM-dependent methyltransferase [Glycomyces albus]